MSLASPVLGEGFEAFAIKAIDDMAVEEIKVITLHPFACRQGGDLDVNRIGFAGYFVGGQVHLRNHGFFPVAHAGNADHFSGWPFECVSAFGVGLLFVVDGEHEFLRRCEWGSVLEVVG